MARTLRKLRAESGVSAAEVGKALSMSGSKLNRIEAAEIGIYQDDLEKLLDYYRVPKKRRVELLDIARHAEQRGWLRMRNANLPADWQAWSDFEDEATALLQYEPLMIPGLLQTPEYARAVIEATGGGLSDDEVDALVASRISRQSVLTKRQPLRLHVLVEEDALNRPFGDAGALARQLRHLEDIATRPNITLQLLPAEAGLHAGLHGAFVVLEYDDEPSLVWLENQLASVFLEEDEQIEGYLASWNDMVVRAHTADESAELIGKMVV
ncbi:helix-turn-helix transcriptional regulator [Saccharopolyspora shandongensis]|uniref:helix-turn-helix domain-containing protein n=1 Tax=Saccharopolyspora shandongensis TaxID=418495 RepID=UPI0033E35F05